MKKIIGYLLVSVIALSFFSCASESKRDVKSADSSYGSPDFVLNDPNGGEFQLSSQRGKLVLLDFWASWCVPCRRSHPDLVEVYDTYKNSKFKNANGLSFVSVSIDEHVQKWREAIQADGLKWDNHAIDPHGWQSSVVSKYGIQGIPMNFLLDSTGKIVAQDLHGDRLRRELDKRLAH